MALWECKACGCRFAVGLRMCPQCTSESVREYTGGTEVSPKISKEQGASYEGGEQGWDGDSSSTSTETPATVTPLSERSDSSLVQTTESLSSTDQTESGTARSTDGETEGDAATAGKYDDLLKDDLVEEARKRELATTGTKAELVARLEEADAVK